MRVLQLGLIVVIAFVALLFSAQGAMAQSPASSPAAPTAQPAPHETATVQASAIEAVGLIITPTVGINSSVCATTNKIQVRAGTPVYYCFTLRHTGNAGDEILTLHHIDSSRGLHRDVSPISLGPGETKNTVQLGFGASFTDSATVDVTDFFTWTARPADGEPQVIAFAHASVDIVTPSVSVVKTVGQDRASCATARFLRVTSGSTVDFCVTIHNTGDITLTNHTLDDPAFGINSANFNYTLVPGQILNITQSNLLSLGISNGSLERTSVASPINNSVSYTGLGVNNLTASGTSTATVDIGTTTVNFRKTVTTQDGDCTGGSTFTVPVGTTVYYCIIIENTGSVTLTHHHLLESQLSIDVSFDYPLPPGQTLNVTNAFLTQHNLPVVFGPFVIDPKYGPENVVGTTMSYTGSSDDGFSVGASAGATVLYPPTPTPTATRHPHTPATPTPFPTSPPTDTDTPLPPTPTETPTETPVTPSPTPTHSYAISLLETPTPRAQSAAVPATPLPPDQSLPPTVDPNLQAQQPPVQDPIIATATQLAVDATTTAVVAEATAAELQIENAQATALAETQATVPVAPSPEAPSPESPLPTPLSPDGSSAGLPVAPGFETPTESPTPLPTTGPAVNLIENGTQPGADAQTTVLPGPVTVEVATATPVILVLIVTNTPEPGAVTTTLESQRPVVYPTPAATADFVMAAARTFDVAVETLGWLWFLVGSLIFFVTTGIVAGLFFRQSEASRFELPDPDYWLEEGPVTARSQAEQSAEDDWPADLP